MTFTFSEVLLLIIAAAAIIAAVFLIRLAGQFARMAEEVEKTMRNLNYLQPKFERLLEQAETELGEIASVTRKADAIAGDVGSVTHQIAHVTLPAISNIAAIAGPLRYAGAALTGAKIGMQVLRQRRRRHHENDEHE